MENASKALIIAGAILLSILIISLGILIFNQASGVAKNQTMDEVEISAFNQKFTQYEGAHVKGAQVNALLSAVVQNNIASQDDTSKRVKIKTESIANSGDGANWNSTIPKDQPTSMSDVGKAMTGKTYDVSCGMTDKSTGLVNEITIKPSSTP